MSRSLVAALTAAEKEFVYAEVPGDHGAFEDDESLWGLVDVFLARHLEPNAPRD